MMDPMGTFVSIVCGFASALGPDEGAKLRGFAALTILYAAWVFDLRVVSYLRSWPLLLLRLAESQWDKFCQGRADTATKLLNDYKASPDTLHPTAKKVATMFEADLVHARDAGTLTSTENGREGEVTKLWLIIRKVREIIIACERFNSILKVIGERARSICLALLSARLCVKGQMETNLAHTSKKGGVIKDSGEKLFAICHTAVVEDRRQRYHREGDYAPKPLADVEADIAALEDPTIPVNTSNMRFSAPEPIEFQCANPGNAKDAKLGKSPIWANKHK